MRTITVNIYEYRYKKHIATDLKSTVEVFNILKTNLLSECEVIDLSSKQAKINIKIFKYSKAVE